MLAIITASHPVNTRTKNEFTSITGFPRIKFAPSNDEKKSNHVASEKKKNLLKSLEYAKADMKITASEP
jgi:hypothetical protein